MKSKSSLFGEWLDSPARGLAVRLVIEEMSEQASAPAAAGACLITESGGMPEISFSSGAGNWPWRADSGDPAASITWASSRETVFSSLRVEQYNETEGMTILSTFEGGIAVYASTRTRAP